MHGSTPTDGSTPFENGMVSIPEQIPIFPLPEVVLLPGEVLPLHIFEPRYRAMVRDALNGHRVIGMVEYDESPPAPSMNTAPPVRDLGCAGFIAEHKELPDGRFLLWLLGLERFTIDEELEVDTLYRQVRVTYSPISASTGSLAGLQPVREELQRVLPRLVELDEADRASLASQMGEISDTQLIALACQILELPADRKRELLTAHDQIDRFMLIYEELYRHLDDHPNFDDPPSHTLN
jgi:Lon protease-like protein